MSFDASLNIFKFDTYLLINPLGLISGSSDWHVSDKLIKVDVLSAPDVGLAALAALHDSSSLELPADNPALTQTRYVTTTITKMAGLKDFADMLRHAKLVDVFRDGPEIKIGHSDRTSEKYRMYPNRSVLVSPTPEQLGAEILAAFERCTDSDD